MAASHGSRAAGFFVSQGVDQHEARRLVTASQDPDLMDRLADAGALSDVLERRKFVKALPALKAKPYDKTEFGENVDALYDVREKLSRCLEQRLRDAEAFLVERTPGADRSAIVAERASLDARLSETNRYALAAWAIWQKHKSKVYISCNTVFAYVYRWNLDSKKLFQHLVKHPQQKNMVTSRDLHECEQAVEAMLRKATTLGLKCGDSPRLDAAQNAAVRTALLSPYSAIQGGAGVGKTTTVSHLVGEVAAQAGVVCLAFTHKAKRCIRAKLLDPEVQVSTIHSFVQSNKNAQLARLFVLLDESSMVDIELLAELARTLLTRCNGYQLCFVGDEQQLQPIGRGEFFRQLIGNGGPGVSVLRKCYRTDRADMFAAYESVREGHMPESSANFEVVYCENDRAVNARLGAMIARMDDAKGVQCVLWQNRDVAKVNTWMQERLIKTGRVGPANWRGYYVNDRVIYRGDTVDGLTNATMGAVVGVVCERGLTKGIVVEWEDKTKTTFVKDVTKDLYLAYAISAHSSQGSEYDRVVVACYDVSKMSKCLDRRWFYTSVTRAKTHVTVIATPDLKDFIAKDLAPQPLTSVVL